MPADFGHRKLPIPYGTHSARDIAVAAIRVRRALEIESHNTNSHRVVVVSGLEDSAVIKNLAIYLVGAGYARAVRTSLRIAAAFLPVDLDDEEELRKAVRAGIGEDNQVTQQFRTDQRDPWIAEGVGHLMFWLSRRAAALAARGRLQSLTTLHVGAKEPGIDLAALFFDDPALGISIGEAKTSEANATAQAADAARFFSEIDDGDPIRYVQVRERVQLLREALRPKYDALVTPALWEDSRCYVPLVAYGRGCSFSPTRARPTYRRLTPGPDRVLLVALPLARYGEFFNTVSDEMRAVV